jgi:hypothetical protein
VTSATAPNPAAQDVGRIPQTTVGLPTGGPFIRYSQGDSEQQGYVSSGNAFGAPISLPLSAVGGFLAHLILQVQATGGTSGGGVVATADAPWSAIAAFTLRDSSGQPIYPSVDGFGLFLINLYSGMCGQAGIQDPRVLPSFSALQTASGAGAGNFLFKLLIPLQFNSSGYCALPMDNSAELPKVFITLGQSTAVYSTPPTTLPTLTVTVEEIYAAVPNNYPDLAPYDVGASAQWMLTTSGQNPPSAAAQRVLDQGVGQFVHTKIYILRDSTNARVDSFPTSDLALWIDNFPYKFELFTDRTDKLAKAFGVGATTAGLQARPTGVIAYTWRQSVQMQVSDADDAEDILVTTGSTKVEVGGTWGTISNQPAQLTCLTGMIFPGPSGWPYGSQGAPASLPAA